MLNICFQDDIIDGRFSLPEEYISDNCLAVIYISLSSSLSIFSENIKKLTGS